MKLASNKYKAISKLLYDHMIKLQEILLFHWNDPGEDGVSVDIFSGQIFIPTVKVANISQVTQPWHKGDGELLQLPVPRTKSQGRGDDLLMGDLADLTVVVGASDFHMSPGIQDAHLNLGHGETFGMTLK
eukprot:15364919-Ditylum_brightwellii.AAC.1